LSKYLQILTSTLPLYNSAKITVAESDSTVSAF